MKKDTIFCFPTKNCLHVITDNYEKTFLGPPFHSVKNYETIKKYSLHVICQISNFKCQLNRIWEIFKKSDEMFLCTHNIKELKSLDYYEEACDSWHLKMCWK